MALSLRGSSNLSCCKRVSISFTKFATSDSSRLRRNSSRNCVSLRVAERFAAGRFVDQLRRAVEILRVDGREYLRRTELGPQRRNALVERGQAAVAGIDAARGFKRLQSDVELAFVQGGLHARKQDLGETLQALAGFAVLGIEQQRASIQRERAALRRIDEVPIRHRLLRLLDDQIDFLIGRRRRFAGCLGRGGCGAVAGVGGTGASPCLIEKNAAAPAAITPTMTAAGIQGIFGAGGRRSGCRRVQRRRTRRAGPCAR